MTPAIAPTTIALAKEPIRPELPAQHYIQQLPSIQNLLLHLEGKGRKPATLQAVEKGLKALALRTDLKNTQAVELAIAGYIKVRARLYGYTSTAEGIRHAHGLLEGKSNLRARYTSPSTRPLKRK